MILSCNSCEKKFVVPDQAITPAGRIVQCGSCGNKWKQFPIKSQIKKTTLEKNRDTQNTSNIKKKSKLKKNRVKKEREINLYSKEYLEKKHGIKLDNTQTNTKFSADKKVSFGFYYSLIVYIVMIIASSRVLYFFQDFIEKYFPFTRFYLDYFFESIRNIFEILKNLISNY